MLTYRGLQRLLVGPLRDQVLYFEARINHAVKAFAAELPAGARVLDAGAGETRYARWFRHCRYTAVDLAIGDPTWDYSALDVIGDLSALPFRDESFDAVLNIVTLEHVPRPWQVLRELWRVLVPGGCMLVVVPLQWEVHQAPHDYYRYTRYGIRWLLEDSGFRVLSIEAVGGFFRLLARRLFNSLQFLPRPLMPVAALLISPIGLIVPVLDALDRTRDFTLGYICVAQKLPGS